MAKKTIHRSEYRELIEHLRQRREKLGLSQTDVALALGWKQQRLSAIEAGARRLDVFEYFELAQSLGLSPQRALKLMFPSGR